MKTFVLSVLKKRLPKTVSFTHTKRMLDKENDMLVIITFYAFLPIIRTTDTSK